MRELAHPRAMRELAHPRAMRELAHPCSGAPPVLAHPLFWRIPCSGALVSLLNRDLLKT